MTELTVNTVNISVKQININDLQLVVDLFNKYRIFYKQPDDVKLANEFLGERLLNSESVIFVALHDHSKPVGFTQLYPKYSSVRAVKNWILNDLYVAEEYRKMGIGEKLIQAAMSFAKNNEAKFVQLETAVTNVTAQSLYEGVGFIKQMSDNDFYVYKINVN